MAKKMGMGKHQVVAIDIVNVRERVSKDGDGNFVGLHVDQVDVVENMEEREAAEELDNGHAELD